MPNKKGLIYLFTGHGKGKTSAALGMALRSIGWGYRVRIIQFMKSTTKYGENRAKKLLGDLLEIDVCGAGFYGIKGDVATEQEHKEAAHKALLLAEKVLTEGNYHLVILDEINNTVHLGLLDQQDVISVLEKRKEGVHVVLTGRDAPPLFEKIADLVTEMREIKHPFYRGIPAARGLDY